MYVIRNRYPTSEEVEQYKVDYLQKIEGDQDCLQSIRDDVFQPKFFLSLTKEFSRLQINYARVRGYYFMVFAIKRSSGFGFVRIYFESSYHYPDTKETISPKYSIITVSSIPSCNELPQAFKNRLKIDPKDVADYLPQSYRIHFLASETNLIQQMIIGMSSKNCFEDAFSHFPVKSFDWKETSFVGCGTDKTRRICEAWLRYRMAYSDLSLNEWRVQDVLGK